MKPLHMQYPLHGFLLALLLGAIGPAQTAPRPQGKLTPQEADYVLRDFHFKSGETLPELPMHYVVLGKPVHNANGRVTNAVLILHGTGGSGRQFLAHNLLTFCLGPASFLTPTATSSSFPTTSATEGRASRAMVCTRTFRDTTMTTWYWRNTTC